MASSDIAVDCSAVQYLMTTALCIGMLHFADQSLYMSRALSSSNQHLRARVREFERMSQVILRQCERG